MVCSTTQPKQILGQFGYKILRGRNENDFIEEIYFTNFSELKKTGGFFQITPRTFDKLKEILKSIVRKQNGTFKFTQQ